MNKNDLRYRKTEANLKQAYLELLVDHDCTDITVKQLCSLAQCARNTFYQHYLDLPTLRDHIIDQVLVNMADAFSSPESDLHAIDSDQINAYCKGIIASVVRERHALQILFSKDDGTFQKRLADVIYAQVLAGDRTLSLVADTPRNRMNTAYLASAVAGFIARWLAEPTVTSQMAEQTLQNIHRATINTSSAYLAGNAD
ncbi:hypothetical protein [Lacticaseibacillus hulanensis]|uniref:hypothetical protein n=1 Tax=Lacticaseibacillus hulanensis TaxID=2493111 RepID=UPI000FDA25B8|nr:hypothetical protein [Lacticaseibacillus hulanensis]